MNKYTVDSINQQIVELFNSEGFTCEFNKHIRDTLQEILTAGYMKKEEELYIALRESCKLQAHYAQLINMWDGGERMIFKSPEEWIARLRKIGTLPKEDETP